MILQGHKDVRKGILVLCLGFFLGPVLMGPAVMAQKVTRLQILNAEVTAYDVKIGKGARKLIGDVRIKHEDVTMNCDSAYYYSSTGSVDAFSRVKVVQGDTLTLTGDYAHYDGETRIARVRNHVKLVNKDVTLVTDTLDYFRNYAYATYRGGGVLTQADQKLTSEKGHFELEEEIFFFSRDVIITNPDYRILTDSLKYDSQTEISYFYGPTEIINPERYIYCENGWYDSRQDISLVNDNAYLKEEGRTLSGDTLYYEREGGYGRARSNVVMFDSLQNLTLTGNFGIYHSEEEMAMMTDSALMIQVDGTDTLWVHADTLRSFQDPEMEEQSRILKAFYKVKIYRHDMQVMCDSLSYVEADSAFEFYGEPVLWSGENQLTSTWMKVLMVDQKLHRMDLHQVAMVISQKDSSRFDQMRGKEMVGYFRDNKLSRIHVQGNGQTIYYADEQGEIVGANKTECTNLMIYMNDNAISRVNYMTKPKGIYYPLEKFPAGESKLPDFRWAASWRPLSPMDIFRWKD